MQNFLGTLTQNAKFVGSLMRNEKLVETLMEKAKLSESLMRNAKCILLLFCMEPPGDIHPACTSPLLGGLFCKRPALADIWEKPNCQRCT
jgi:hypothetical protein